MPKTITQAMILAAGFGTRLRPITDTIPKAMARVDGKPLLDYALDHASRADVTNIVVNTHYLPQVIHDHLQGQDISISHEKEILETGGGIQNVIGQFGGEAFYAINADSLWVENGEAVLAQLARIWEDEKMDVLLALIPNLHQYPDLQGDFAMRQGGRLERDGVPKPMPYHYIGVQILHPRLFDGTRPERFSLNILYDRAEKQGRLFGHMAKGIEWFHISTPKDLQDTNRYFTDKKRPVA